MSNKRSPITPTKPGPKPAPPKTSLRPETGNVSPGFRAALPTGPDHPQTGSTSIRQVAPPAQTFAAQLFAAKRQVGPGSHVGNPVNPATPAVVPKADDCQNLPYAPPQSLQRPRNWGYDRQQDELRLGNTVDRSGGGKVTEPFTPEYPDNSTS
jgi:hypothetical protein